MSSLVELTGAPIICANDFVVARNMAETLHKHYPGFQWAVTCDGSKGMATVRNLSLSGMWGFQIRLRELFADPEMKMIVRAGGEILERFRVSRSLRQSLIHERVMELPTLPSGAPVFDPAQAKSKVPRYIKDAWTKHS